MAIILISKLQIFDKGENRYVLCNFNYATQFARNFVAKLVKSFAELFQKRPFFLCNFSPLNPNLCVIFLTEAMVPALNVAYTTAERFKI